MLDEKLQEQLLETFDKRFQDYNTKVLEELGNVIKQFKDLTPSQAHKLAQQLKYNTTIKDLLNELSKISGLSVKDLKAILEKVAKENIEFADVYYKARGLETPIYEQNKELQRLVNSVYSIAGKEFKNIAKNTGFRLLDNDGNPLLLDIDKTYKYVIDKCVIAISQGKETYQQSMRSTLKQLSSSGVRKIEYESGYSRRLDTSIRQNILDSIRQVSNESQQLFGKEFDSDGVEISVHLNPAPDHADIQGHQFSFEEFNKFKDDKEFKDLKGNKFLPTDERGQDRRNIGQYNCYHYLFNIVAGVSKPQYTDKQLQEINERNEKGFEFEDKHYTMYEGTQLQRKIETAIRQEKDEQILNKASGFNDLVLENQTRITQLNTKYKQLCNVSGLPNKLSARASVSGYKRTKIDIKNAPEIKYARKNNTIWHSTENLEEIIKDDEIVTPSLAVGKELNAKVKYGTQFIEFKPEILQYVNENTFLYKGDGGNKYSQKSEQFSSLMQMLKDEPEYYNELKFNNNLKSIKYIKKVYIRQDEPKEVINLLKKYKINFEIYTDYRERDFKKKGKRI